MAPEPIEPGPVLRRAAEIRFFAGRRRVERAAVVVVDATSPVVIAEFGPNATLVDEVGLELDLEELLGTSVDVLSAGTLTAEDRPMLERAVWL